MSARSHWTFGGSTLRRIVEFEAPTLSPFEIFGDCTQAHLDWNRSWLVPRFQDAASGILILSIQSFLIRRSGLTVLVDACGGWIALDERFEETWVPLAEWEARFAAWEAERQRSAPG